jgi:DNA invertase Pin-like site-specific DNA recombinase
MRVIGYVRDLGGPDTGDTVFVQSERIRRWVAQNRCQLVAVCQDTPSTSGVDDRDGYRALLGIVSAGHVDTVLLSELTSLSPDVMTQEIMLHDLRTRGIKVISTEDADLSALAEPATDPGRLLMRDVLAKHQAHEARFGKAGEGITPTDDQDVLIELIPHADEVPSIKAS